MIRAYCYYMHPVYPNKIELRASADGCHANSKLIAVINAAEAYKNKPYFQTLASIEDEEVF